MSVDNTIGILVTRRRDGQEGNEYRVGHAQAFGNMTYESDYPSRDRARFNRDWVRRVFAQSHVFLNEDDARSVAKRLERQEGCVEYGIKLFDCSDLYFPASDRKRQRRQRHGALKKDRVGIPPIAFRSQAGSWEEILGPSDKIDL